MRFLLVTDLDNTLVGDDPATLALNQILGSFDEAFCLVYATGRSYASARQLQSEKQLLEPNFWVTGVGTEIYAGDQLDLQWAEKLSQNWDRDAIVSVTRAFPELLPQPESEQNPWKLSFLLYSDHAHQILCDLQETLTAAGLAAQIVFSSNVDVDILPRQGDKGLAMTYLRQGLRIAPEKTLVCGDSGNDISLFQHSTLGVIVQNARSELLEWYQQSGRSHHYLAKSGYAAGILEALRHFQLI